MYLSTSKRLISQLKRRSFLMFMLFCSMIISFTWHSNDHAHAEDFVQVKQEHIDEAVAEWHKLNEWARSAREKAEKKEYAAAKEDVQLVADAFIHLEASDYVDYPEQAYIILETIIRAKESLAAADLDEQQIQKDLLKMRLVLNAVVHEQRPLWLEYLAPLEKGIMDLKHSLANEERDQFFLHLNRLAVHYELVRSSIIVSHPPAVHAELDAHLAYFLQQKAKMWQDKERTDQMLDSLHIQLRNAFFEENREQQSFIILLISMVLFISLALAYVAYLKYRAEKRAREVSLRQFLS